MNEDRVLTLSNSQATIDLYSWAHNGPELPGIEALAGITGFGFASRTNRWVEGVGSGGVYMGGRTNMKTITLPLWASADNRDGLNELMSELAQMFHTDDDPPQLTYGSGSGKLWSMEVIRESGGDYTRRVQDSNNRTWFKTTFVLQAGVPYWTQTSAESLRVAQVGIVSYGLMPYLAKLQLSASGVFGQVAMVNSGDVSAPIQWELTGPFTQVNLESARGEQLEWIGSIASGRKLFIQDGTVIDDTGANRYDGLSPAPQFWEAPPKNNMVTVSLTGASSVSEVIGSWFPRRWGIV